ncbi:MAG: carbamoyltransferase C-terminal domain-containing protein [Blastocatellia bacterium]
MTKDSAPWILGISASHNGAACLMHGDELIVAIQEERLSRQKRHRIYAAETTLSIPYCLSYAGIDPAQLDMVVVSVAGRAMHPSQDLRSNPYLKEALRSVRLLTIPHHFGHAVSAFATSGFGESAVLVVDGMGSPEEDLFEDERAVVKQRVEDGWEIISLYAASDTRVTPIEKHMVERAEWLRWAGEEMPRFGSLGGLFSAVAHQVFNNAMDAGKVMGLAPYGNVTFSADEFFDISRGRFVFLDKVPERFNHSDRWPLRQDEYSDLSCSVQQALEEALLYLVGQLRELGPSENLCYAGGVALNSVANERIIRESGFKRVHITPVAEDSGPAVGAAYYGLWQLTRQYTPRRLILDACGRIYSPQSISLAIAGERGVRFVWSKDILSDTVELLCAGMTVGWFDGGSELGPRALGQRSILCDPRRADAKAILNARVKRREPFRPFAPAILIEEVGNWFEGDGDLESAFMLRVCEFRRDKVDLVPAVVHVDNTGRVQTLTREANGRFYELVKKFFERTGVPILLNTSFNVMGTPIVETPGDAIECLLSSGLDCCVFDDRIVYKQMNW